jgi:hypothetical protein
MPTLSSGLMEMQRSLTRESTSRFWKRIAAATVVLLSFSILAQTVSSGNSEPKSSYSTIIGFSPTSFEAKASATFFYSINDELKYSDQIDPHAPTLTHGPIIHFQVSPDGNKIAVVIKKKLLIVGADSTLGEVGGVDSIYRNFKPVGRRFFRDTDFQWSRDSKSLYLIRDEFRSLGTQSIVSEKEELWRYDLDSKSLQMVLKPFAAFHYFSGLNSGIYYSESTGRGDVQLKFFNGSNSTNVGTPASTDLLELLERTGEQPFYFFSTVDYEDALPSLNVRVVDENSVEDLIINDKKYLSVTQGYNWMSDYSYCPILLRSVFLPGNRFFMLNVPYCGNYKGQLLFDVESGGIRNFLRKQWSSQR